ncbi:hypothetical protein K490DRAFT_51468 [Saccharata proteae CBS 121410]|uniref:Uncharacterized protein n=1 Tax=Saccharata proteae CBS 121410 TaxID=1314787 RepID=A0A9P4HMG3_9PEZI|nr:hypothetical protein K490DRAFT_51468 [Saccharata proteae CBS 121410]
MADETSESQTSRSYYENGAENQSSRFNGYSNLDEVRGPPPVEDSGNAGLYQRHDLEEARWAASNEENPQADTSAKNRTPSEKEQRMQAYLKQLYVSSYLVFFSILGTLARLGLQTLTDYPGSPFLPTELWANVAGCFIMGYLSEDRMFFQREWNNAMTSAQKGLQTPEGSEADDRTSISEPVITKAQRTHNAAKKTVPLYIGLTVGFCGSLTSFSSFMRDSFLAMANDLSNDIATPYPRNDGYSVMALLGVIFIEVSLSMSSLIVGAHMAMFMDPLKSKVSSIGARRVLDPAVVLLGWGIWLGAVFMAIWPPDRPGGPAAGSRTSWAQETWRGQAIFALVFAPLGCFLRFFASLRLNGLFAAFPMGTFAVNIVGTAVIGMCWDLQHARLGSGLIGGGRVGCQVLEGVIDGFCGCLTTVSTWAVELKGLERKHAYFYGLTSIAAGVMLLVVIMGPLLWTGNAHALACVV